MEALLRPGTRPVLVDTSRFRSLRRVGRRIGSAAAPQSHGSEIYQDLSRRPPPSLLSSGETQPPPNARRENHLRDAKPFSYFLTDNYHRQHNYLRISVTERCNLRCTYCMPAEGVPLSPPAHLLTTPEIVYLSELFVKEGVTKIRLTGGEPTVRKDILPLMHEVGQLRSKGLQELCLTTNGISLHRKLDAMVGAGLTGINLSLDTLDPHQFQIMTRRKGFEAVMKSLERILEMNRLGAGIKLKLNVVVMRGVNEREIVPFVELGKSHDIEIRFIEYMPFDGNKWSRQKMLSYKEMVAIIQQSYPGLSKKQDESRNETSKTWQVPGFRGKVGFITSMTENFCGTCNRLRITGDGNLKVCLFGNSEVSLRDLLREGNNGEPLDWAAMEAIREMEMDRPQTPPTSTGQLARGERERGLLEVIGMAVKRKKEKHAGMGQLENMKNRPMILIGNANPHVSEVGGSIPAAQILGTPLSWISQLQRKGLPRTPPQLSGILPFSHELYRQYHSTASLLKQAGARKERRLRKGGIETDTPGTFGANLPDFRIRYRPQGEANVSVQPRYSSKTTATPSTPLAEDVAETSFLSQPERPKWVMDRHPELNLNWTDPTRSTSPISPLSPSPSSPAPESPNHSQSSEQSPSTSHLPHLTPSSAAHQISISHKSLTHRAAVAIGSVRFSTPNLLPLVQKHALKKGDVLSVSRVAGIMAVKRTADLIPLAHAGVAVEGCTVDLGLVDPGDPSLVVKPEGQGLTEANMGKWMKEPLSPHGGIRIKVSVETTAKTGVEMEALAGVMGAALTVVDMCKAADKHLLVGEVTVVGKKGGKSGAWGVLVADNKPPQHDEEMGRTRAEDMSGKSSSTEERDTLPGTLIRRTNDYRGLSNLQAAVQLAARRQREPRVSAEVESQRQEEEEQANQLLRDSSSGGALPRRVVSKKQEGVQWKPVDLNDDGSEAETGTKTLERVLRAGKGPGKGEARWFHESNKESGRLRAPPPTSFEKPRTKEGGKDKAWEAKMKKRIMKRKGKGTR